MDSHAQPFSAKILAMAHATEDPERVAQAIRNLFLDETLTVTATNRVKGHHGNEIVTFLVTIRNGKIVEKFLENIWDGLTSLDRNEVYSTLASRIDSTGTLFLRIDKQEALRGKIRIQDADPIRIGISFRANTSTSDELVRRIRRKLEEITGSE